jgi:hypothetical protein
MRATLPVIAALSLLLGSVAIAHSSGSNTSGHTTSHSTTHSSHAGASPGVPRDSKGHIKRSSSARKEFEHSHPCPSTGKTSGSCPGYVVDHVQALKHGGADAPGNMQWQTKEAAKAKDKVE